jgi:predicted dehydrogenase
VVATNQRPIEQAGVSAKSAVRSGLIVGYGSIGERHLANLRATRPDVDVTVVTQRGDVAPGRVRHVARLEDAIGAKPSFAIIAGPSHVHADQLIELLGAGIACYIEKPVAVSMEQVERIHGALAMIEPLPVTFAGCNLRFLPSLAKVQTLIANGAIGKPIRANLQAGQWLPDWRPAREYMTGYSADAVRGGGVMLDLIHEFDQARWLLGEFDEIAAVAGRASSLRIDAEDSACVILRGAGGAPVVAIGLDYISRRPVRRYEVIGEEGTLVWDLQTQSLRLVRRDTVDAVDCGADAFDIARTYVTALMDFLRDVELGEPTSQDVREGLRTAELALRARAAAGL